MLGSSVAYTKISRSARHRQHRLTARSALRPHLEDRPRPVAHIQIPLPIERDPRRNPHPLRIRRHRPRRRHAVHRPLRPRAHIQIPIRAKRQPRRIHQLAHKRPHLKVPRNREHRHRHALPARARHRRIHLPIRIHRRVRHRMQVLRHRHRDPQLQRIAHPAIASRQHHLARDRPLRNPHHRPPRPAQRQRTPAVSPTVTRGNTAPAPAPFALAPPTALAPEAGPPTCSPLPRSSTSPPGIAAPGLSDTSFGPSPRAPCSKGLISPSA